MNNDIDIFGLAFHDYLAGNTSGVIKVKTMLAEFTENESLPVAYFFRTFDEMPEWEQQALNLCMGSVLDVGAGAGAHSLELQKRGMEVCAVDVSPGAVDIMKIRGVHEVFCVDVMTFSARIFDTILLLMNGIGMAKNLDGLKKLLLHLKSLLRPGGRIILESTDILYMFREEDGSILLPLGARYYGEIKYQLYYSNKKGKTFPWLFVDKDNLSAIASECGYLTKILYDGETSNYLAVLQLN